MLGKKSDATSLVQYTKTMLDVVSNYQPEEMKKVFAKLAALKEALKAADMFYEASVQFAQLEAYALIRAVELSNGEQPSLTGANKTLRSKAAVWLFNMTEAERASVIEKCKEGKTIVAIYKEVTDPTDKERASAIKIQLNRNVALDLKRNGIAVINTYENQRLIQSLPFNLQQDVKDGLRNLLLKKGAVGIGDDKGTYIIPDSNNGKVKEALETRLASMQNDFTNFLIVARKCTYKPYFEIIVDRKYPDLLFRQLLLVLAAADDAIDLYINQEAQKALSEKHRFVEKTVALKSAELMKNSMGGVPC